MRLLPVLALVVLPSIGFAGTVQDRYGPPPAERPVTAPRSNAQAYADAYAGPTEVAAAPAYHGRYLTWSSRVRTPATTARMEAPTRVASIAPPPSYQPAPQALPQSLYAQPRPMTPPPTARPAPPPVAAAYAPAYVAPTPRPAPAPVVMAPRPSPAPVAAAPPPPVAPALIQSPTQQVQVAAAAPAPSSSAPTHARFYSLHREYGDTPDRVALPPSRPMVLIGPAEAPPKPDADAPADKPAKPSSAAIF